MGDVPIVGDILSPPKPPALPPPPPPPPSEVDPSVIESRQRRKRAASSIKGGTSLTGSQGISGDAPSTKKTLLGS